MIVAKTVTAEPHAGSQRSFWAEAGARIMRNRAAVAGFFVFAVILLSCLIGPHLVGHAYDAVYQDYVRTPPRLTTYPATEQIERAVERITGRMRTRTESLDLTPDAARIAISGRVPIDERLLAFFERSNLFWRATVLERSDNGRRLVVEVPIGTTDSCSAPMLMAVTSSRARSWPGGFPCRSDCLPRSSLS